MKGKSSSGVKGVEVMQRSSESKEESHLSGAYIRSLVKHLSSSSRLKDQTLNLKSPDSTLEGRLDEAQPPPPPPPPPPKKQLRRRLHTRRPYQERLLNMAEARREIVHALKLHRASMKQANGRPPTATSTNPNPNSSHNVDQPNITYPSSAWSYPTFAPLDNFCLSLPNYQPLGLNLNFQGFNNVDAPFNSSNITNDPHIQLLSPQASSSSSHSYSSPPMCTDNGDTKMHIAMDEKEMEEIRLIGEKHDIEWNDSVNLVTSAWWSNFLEVDDSMEGSGFRAFDNYCSLPCLDTGEIEWMDDD